jgi:hypothetical protein
LVPIRYLSFDILALPVFGVNFTKIPHSSFIN